MLKKEGLEVRLVEEMLSDSYKMKNESRMFHKVRKLHIGKAKRYPYKNSKLDLDHNDDMGSIGYIKEDHLEGVRANAKEEKKSIKQFLIILALSVGIPFILMFGITFRTHVPSQSMVPTVAPGDDLIVLRSFTHEGFERDEILVFWSEEFDNMLIKRLIGLPGDLIELKDGKLYVNSREHEEEYVKFPADFDGSWLIPDEHYFFLGDNRSESIDARFWQNPFIPKDAIKGKALAIVGPITRMKLL